jgi:arylsulfatase A-like enzyme
MIGAAAQRCGRRSKPDRPCAAAAGQEDETIPSGIARKPLGLAHVLVLVVLVGCAGEVPRFERIVLIVVDTLRRDHLGVYGGPADTPAIDELARRGTTFVNARASFHQTTMSMAALFTGRVPALEWASHAIAPLAFNSSTWCGLHRYAVPGDPCVPTSVRTLSERAGQAGFETLGVVSNPLLHAPAGYERGFDDWAEVGALAAFGRPMKRRALARARRAEAVLAAAERVLRRRDSDRFLLYVHFMDAHDWRLAGRSSYVEGVEASDAGVGALLDLLEEQGLLDGALVVLTADHGEMLPGDPVLVPQRGHTGNPSFEPVLDVPLIVVPEVELPTDRPIRTDQLGGLLLDLVGADAEADGAGSDVLAPDETFTSEMSWRTYRHGHWKSAWRRDGETVHLFDLDQGERTDVASRHPEVLEAHRARIEEITARLGDEQASRPEALDPSDVELLRALGYAD